MTSVGKDMFKYGLVLALFCAIAASGLAFTYGQTKVIMDARAKEESEKACRLVMPDAEFDKRDDLLEAAMADHSDVLGGGKGAIFDATKNGELAGAVIQLASPGFHGPVTVAAAIEGGKITGFMVVEQTETQGLGTKIQDDPEWAQQFVGKTVLDGFVVKADVQSVSGATISSRAVATAAQQAVLIFNELYGGGSR